MNAATLQSGSEQRSAAPSRDGRGFRVVRIVLGLLLVAAAGLKLYGLNVTALPRVGWFATSQVQLAAAEWELVLGLWLLSGAAQQLAWLAAIGTFSVFAVVSAYFGWIGVASCGCFGAIRASPWTAFGVDIAALFALALFRPRRSREASGDFCGDFFHPARLGGPSIVLLSAVGILVALTGIGSWVYGSPAAALALLRGESLSLSSTTIDFNSVEAGKLAQQSISFRNWTDEPIRIFALAPICGLAIRADLPLDLPARESRELTLKMHVPMGIQGELSVQSGCWTDSPRAPYVPYRIRCRVLAQSTNIESAP